MSETVRDVEQWGITRTVAATLLDHAEAGAVDRLLADHWVEAVEAAGYVALGDPRIESEPRWIAESDDPDVPTMWLPMGEGKPDLFEYRIVGEVVAQ